MSEENPYASPTEVDEPPPTAAPGSADAVRRAHLPHESAVRAAGWLFLFPAAPLLALAVGSLGGVVGAAVSQSVTSGREYVVSAAIYGGLGLYFLWIGLGLRGLASRPRAWAIALSAIGLLRLPFGTIVNGYLVWLLAKAETDYLFSSEYKTVIAATPYVRPKATKLVWGLLSLLVVDVVGIVLLIVWTIPV